MKQSKANPCLEAESLGLNRNKQRNHVVHLAVGKMLKTPFKTRKESQEQQKVNSSQKRRWHAQEILTADDYLQGWQKEWNQPDMGKHQTWGKRS